MAVNHVRLCKVWATLCTCFWRRVFVATSFGLARFGGPLRIRLLRDVRVIESGDCTLFIVQGGPYFN